METQRDDSREAKARWAGLLETTDAFEAGELRRRMLAAKLLRGGTAGTRLVEAVEELID